ncbi:hypothetical protein EVAR_102492_1 [Eumeta japonica]|uniref:Uncharacterized protein n=1 Tax=Eumeta variegata TaxID=151549 RepID=A0A4C1ZHG2_EUMVA|nr:hypothetical protein EVAR_102492_1 [Eumeta japonica]
MHRETLLPYPRSAYPRSRPRQARPLLSAVEEFKTNLTSQPCAPRWSRSAAPVRVKDIVNTPFPRSLDDERQFNGQFNVRIENEIGIESKARTGTESENETGSKLSVSRYQNQKPDQDRSTKNEELAFDFVQIGIVTGSGIRIESGTGNRIDNGTGIRIESEIGIEINIDSCKDEEIHSIFMLVEL